MVYTRTLSPLAPWDVSKRDISYTIQADSDLCVCAPPFQKALFYRIEAAMSWFGSSGVPKQV